jgi:type I restriction-modification system specificity determinant
MSRLADLINELCPDGVEYKPLGEVAELKRGSGMPKKMFTDAGIPAIHYGHIYTKYGIYTKVAAAYVDKANSQKLTSVYPGDLVVANTSENLEDVGKAVTWLGESVAVTGGHATVVRSSAVNTVFLSYYFRTEEFSRKKQRYSRGTKVIELSAVNLAKILIPVPPLEVQREIVRILDQFTTLEAELEAELEARRAQYEYYREQLLSYDALVSRCPNGVEYKSIGSFSKCVAGATPNSKNPSLWDGDIPWMSSGEVNKKTVYSTNRFITQLGFDSCSTKMVPAGAVVIALAGQGKTRGTVARIRIELCTNQSLCAIITDKTVDSDYLFHYLSGQYDNLRAVSSGDGTRGGLNLKMIRAYKVPVPPIEEQRRIADVLDRFDALVNDISSGLPAEIAARRAQYEYYRDRLLSFPEKK